MPLAPVQRRTMVLSAPVIALGATLGTATSILALCGLTCLCKCKQPGKGLSDKDQEEDTENPKPSVLQPVQQVRHSLSNLPWDSPLNAEGGNATSVGLLSM